MKRKEARNGGKGSRGEVRGFGWRGKLLVTSGLLCARVALPGAAEEVFELAPYEVEEGAADRQLSNPRLGARLEALPQGATVLTEEVLSQRSVTDLDEAVLLSSSAQPGDNYLAPYRLRGFAASLSTNGVTQGEYANNTFFNEAVTVERVEILKGPASIQYGDVEPGGVVNRVTKKPEGSFGAGAGIRFGVGRHGQELTEASIDVTGSLLEEREMNGRMIAMRRERDSFRDFIEYEETLVAPSLSIRPFARTKVLLEAQWEEEESFLDRGLPTVGAVGAGSDLTADGRLDLPPRRNLQSPENRYRNENISLRLRMEQIITEDIRVNLQLFGEYFEETRDSTDFFARSTFESLLGPLPPNTVGRFTNDQFSENHLFGLQADAAGALRAGDWENRLRLGVDLRREDELRDSVVGLASPINVFNPVYGLAPPAPLELPDDRDRDIETRGAFLQNRLVSPNERVLLLAALRYDDFDAETRTPDSRFGFGEEAVTPQAGFVVEATSDISLYGSYVESFKAPDPAGGTLSNGEPPDPETAWQVEGGVRWAPNPNLLATASAYQIVKKDVVFTTNDVPPQSVQIGEQRSAGIEVEIIGQLTSQWRILASGSYNETEVEDGFFSNPATGENENVAGNPLPNTPEWAAGVHTDYRIPEGSLLEGWSGGLSLLYRGSRSGDLNRTFSMDAYTRVDAHFAYEKDGWRVRFAVRNLFDTRYDLLANQPVSVLPGAPVNGMIEIGYRF